MKAAYLDSNIFIYLSDRKSKFYLKCLEFINHCMRGDILIITSVETFQEIIYYSKRINKLKEGLNSARTTYKIVDEILSIDEKIIEEYLRLVERYKNADSRDIIHLAVSLENNIETIITYDKGFKKFKEIKAVTPEEFLNYGRI